MMAIRGMLAMTGMVAMMATTGMAAMMAMMAMTAVIQNQRSDLDRRSLPDRRSRGRGIIPDGGGGSPDADPVRMRILARIPPGSAMLARTGDPARSNDPRQAKSIVIYGADGLGGAN